MRYLHAVYTPDKPDHLLFFGEDYSTPAPKKRGRRPKTIDLYPHPYGLQYHDLVREVIGDDSEASVTEDEVTTSLPTINKTPLIPDEYEPSEQVAFHPFRYPAVSVPVQSLIEILPSLGTDRNEKTIISDSVRFYQIAYAFALESISRELFLPEISDTGPTGRWAGFFGPDEQERLRDLAGAMPGICYAYAENWGNPELLLRQFIQDVMNAVIKSALHEKPVPIHGRAKSGKNQAAEWVLTLWGEREPGTAEIITDEKMKTGISSWISDPFKDSGSRPFYTCLRLDEPSESSGEFQVKFHIQASDDPSLLISAEEIWKKRSATITYLNRRFERPSEQLLSDLFRAGKIFSPIQDALKKRAPSQMILASDQVYPFLHDAVPLLRQHNIQVMLPSWWKDAAKRPSLRLLVSQKQKKKSRKGHGFFTPDALLSYSWEISLGDITISSDEFFRLVDLKKPLVNIGGKWAAFNPDDIKKAIQTFERAYPGGEINGMDAIRLGLTGQDESGLSIGVTGEDTTTEAFLTEFLGDETKRPLTPVTVPKTFTGSLRPYQEKGLSWLSFITNTGFGACLADDMGLGKTVQFIAYLLVCKKENLHKTALLICPMSLIGNWQREITRFAPTVTFSVHHGQGRKAGDDFQKMVDDHDIILSTYQTVARDDALFGGYTWSMIVLDEAQNIKNSETRQTRAVRKLKGERRIALTGTPVENRLTELWSIMEFLNPGFLGSEKSFEKRYSTLIEKYHDKEAAERLSRLVRPFILRRVKTDTSIIADLPEKNIMRRYCTLTTEQATLYQAMVQSLLLEVDETEGITRRAKILTALLRLKQICNHPGAFLDDGSIKPDRSGKIEMLFSLLEEVLAAGDAAILFTQFSSFGEKLVPLIEKTFKEEVLFLHGGTSRKARDEMVQKFSHPYGPKLFILSLKAGGVGLNLTRANHVFHIDRWWNPAVEDQATDRAFRIGQKKNVSVHLLISAGTIEERIDMLIEEKRRLAGSIIGTGEDWITSLSTDELRDLVSLRGELIGGDI